MASKKNQITNTNTIPAEENVNESEMAALDKLTADTIKEINKSQQQEIAYNLAKENAPTKVKRWISSGSELFDYILSDVKNGGFPEGRIVEISGESGKGKSHIAAQICKSVQKMGGIAIYLDTENATDPSNLESLGVNTNRQFIFVEPRYVEEVFEVVESTVDKINATNKKCPVVVVWDSLAATPAKAELEGDYDQSHVGVQARALGKGFRKITQVIASKNVVFVVINQLREKIGVMFGDPTTTPGGKALPFYASIRVRLQGGAFIYEDPNNKSEPPIGINVEAKTIKNRMTAPQRRANFRVIFGVGIDDSDEVFDVCREWSDAQEKEEVPVLLENHIVRVLGAQSWKTITVSDSDGVVIAEDKFYKKDFKKIRHDPRFKKWIDLLLEEAMVIKKKNEDPEEGEVESEQ